MDDLTSPAASRKPLLGAGGLLVVLVVAGASARPGTGIGGARSRGTRRSRAAICGSRISRTARSRSTSPARARSSRVSRQARNGFIRGVLRGLARERRQHEVGAEPPFRLTRWDEWPADARGPRNRPRGSSSRRSGQTNRDAFARLLPSASEASMIGAARVGHSCRGALHRRHRAHARQPARLCRAAGDRGRPWRRGPRPRRADRCRPMASASCASGGRGGRGPAGSTACGPQLARQFELTELYEVGFSSWRCP